MGIGVIARFHSVEQVRMRNFVPERAVHYRFSPYATEEIGDNIRVRMALLRSVYVYRTFGCNTRNRHQPHTHM